VDLQDVVRAMIELTKSDIHSERFVLLAKNCSNKEILSLIATGFGKPRPFICIGKRLLWNWIFG
jgi:nucleoside-diphosphate-sugar epimerase